MKNYFKRKDLILIGMGVLYFILAVFVEACLDSSFLFVSDENPFALYAKLLGLTLVNPQIGGYLFVSLAILYLLIMSIALVFEIRYFRSNKAALSPKAWIIYVATVVIALGLSFGVGVLIQLPFSGDNIANSFTFLGEVLIVTTSVYLVLVLLVGSILMILHNFIHVHEPYRKDADTVTTGVEEEEEQISSSADVAASFGDAAPIVASGEGALAVGGGVASGAAVVELDDRDKVFPTLSIIDSKYEGAQAPKLESNKVTLEELARGFRNYLAKHEGLFFDENSIRAFIAGFGTTRLMILEGLSGTGKSSLPRYFAKYVSGKATFLPVQATWRDKTSILGYYNNFDGTYNETPLLAALYEASYDQDRINVLVLDEMNISRVEYYFADFLSVLEFPEEDWKIKIMNFPRSFFPPTNLPGGEIQIPTNCYFVGTANKDDSTFAITSKVYDRATVIGFDNRNDPFEVKEKADPITLSASSLKKLYEEAYADEGKKLSDKELSKYNIIANYISEEFGVNYGNRILAQMEEFVPAFVACGGKKEDALDFFLSQKILPKLEGRFEDFVKDGLLHIEELLNEHYEKDEFALSRALLKKMIRRL